MSFGITLLNWTMENIINTKKVALVTGGTKGIGKSIAVKLKYKGYKVIICSRNDNNIDILPDIDYYKIDISNYDDVQKLYNNILDKYGRLDILINNAGIEGSNEKFINTDICDINNIINVNILGTLYVTRAMIEILKKTKGTIVNISSIAAGNSILNCFRRTLYSLTKSSIGTFTRGLAGELKNICNVYSINPPFVDTDMLDRISNENDINKNTINSFGMIKSQTELLKPNDISNFISILIDGKTRYKSGDEILILDKNKTSYMKYVYEKVDIKDNIKYSIEDVEEYSKNNLCFFQGQGLKISIDFDIIKKYIKENKYDEIFLKTINTDFNNLLYNFNKSQDNTFYQQLIIFITSYVLFNIQKSQEPEFYNNIRYMMGYSIGEITALVCSEKISFEDGLNIVFTRARNMHLISQNINTAMITVKGLNTNECLNHLSLNLFLSININETTNVVGGDKDELLLFKEKINNLYGNVKIYDLLVEGAYHTPYYKDVAYDLAKILENITYKENNINIFSNYESTVYSMNNYKELIQKQVYNKVDCFKTMNILKSIDIIDCKEIICSNSFLINQFNT